MNFLRKALLGFLALTPSITLAALPQQFPNDVIFNGNVKLNSTMQGVQASTPETGDITALNTAGVYQLRLTGAAPALRGFGGGVAGKELLVINATGAEQTVYDNDPAAPAANRVRTGTDKDLAFPPNAAFRFVYDGTSNVWRVAGGGAGGTEITAVAPLAYDEDTTQLSIPAATNSVDGYLTAADRAAFAAKQPAGNYVTSGTGEATFSGPGAASVTLSNSAVIGKTLTGFTAGAGTVSAADSILTGMQKNAGNIAANTSAIATNTSNIASNTTAIGTNTTNITDLQGRTGQLEKGTPDLLQNISFYPTVASNAMTLNLSDAAGSVPSVGSSVKVAFRNNMAIPTINTRTLTGALTLTVPAGAPLGLASTQGYLYAYLLDNSGTVEWAISAKGNFDEATLQDTVAISSTANDATKLYSATARTGVPIRLVGRIKVYNAVPGTYASLSGWDYGPLTRKQSGAAQFNIGGTLVGTIQIYGCSSDFSQSNASNFTNFSTRTGCQYYVVPGSVGISAPSTNIPGFTLSGKLGAYRMEAIGSFASTDAQGYQSYYRFSDGTKFSRGDNVVHQDGAGTTSMSNTVLGNIDYTDAGPNAATIQIQARTRGVNNARIYATASSLTPTNEAYVLTINVYRMPTEGMVNGAILDQNSVRNLTGFTLTRTTGAMVNQIGYYRSYLRNGGTGFSETNGAPTAAPSAADGFRLYTSGTYSTPDANGQPSKYDFFIPKGMKYDVVFYKTTNRGGKVNVTPSTYTSVYELGVLTGYDESTQTLTVMGNTVSANPNPRLGFDLDNLSYLSTVYFDVILYTNPYALQFANAEDEVMLSGHLGPSSTNTAIPYFNAIALNRGSLEVVNSSSTGAGVKATKDGFYYCGGSYDINSGGNWAGCIIEGYAPLTSSGNLFPHLSLFWRDISPANVGGYLTSGGGFRYVRAGQWIRPMQQVGTSSGANSQYGFFYVARVPTSAFDGGGSDLGFEPSYSAHVNDAGVVQKNREGLLTVAAGGSVTKPGTGQYTLVFPTGKFSQDPICHIENAQMGTWAFGYPSRDCGALAPFTKTGGTVLCAINNGNATDLPFVITCKGPK